MITEVKYFSNLAKIPNLREPSETGDPLNKVFYEEVVNLADKLEDVFLFDFFLSKEAVADFHDLVKKDEKTKNEEEFVNAFKSPLAHYIAFHYFRNNEIMVTGVGGVKTQTQVGTNASTFRRQVLIWNFMVEKVREIFTTYYNKKDFPMSEIFYKINHFNI